MTRIEIIQKKALRFVFDDNMSEYTELLRKAIVKYHI